MIRGIPSLIIIVIAALIIVAIAQQFVVPSDMCGVQNCHGLQVSCGPNIPDACTQEYQLGDACRPFMKCAVTQGSCQQVEIPHYQQCRDCVEQCLQDFHGEDRFACEANCGLIPLL